MAVDRPLPRLARLPRPPLRDLTFIALNGLGLVAYLHPFFALGARDEASGWYLHGTDAPLVFAAVAALCLVLVIAELTGGGLNSKSLAVLGVLAALAAVMRTVTLPAGANLYFFLVILGGYVFGPRMGFLLGALSFFLSAVVTGGIGPWLPFQMFASAWLATAAGLLRPLVGRLGVGGRAEVGLLAAFGACAAVFYGAVINLWSWPFWVGGPDVTYEPGLGAAEAGRRYWNFYLLTSFGWDLVGSVCNAAVLAVLGGPLLRALTRFRARFIWDRVPGPL
ncbi:MAG: ECF transporter S component [Dehalococcoidia bacterium]|nr:ECF transporter S component [Dehalococcoidia bacterium]